MTRRATCGGPYLAAARANHLMSIAYAMEAQAAALAHAQQQGGALAYPGGGAPPPGAAWPRRPTPTRVSPDAGCAIM